MGLFDGLNETASLTDRPFFREGAYLVAVEACKAIRSEDSKMGKNSFIVEARIIESSEPTLLPGTVCSWVTSWQSADPKATKTQMAFGNIKAFLLAALDVGECNVQEAAELVTSAVNPLNGMRLGLICRAIKTKNGGDFTRHTWSRVPA